MTRPEWVSDFGFIAWDGLIERHWGVEILGAVTLGDWETVRATCSTSFAG